MPKYTNSVVVVGRGKKKGGQRKQPGAKKGG